MVHVLFETHRLRRNSSLRASEETEPSVVLTPVPPRFDGLACLDHHKILPPSSFNDSLRS